MLPWITASVAFLLVAILAWKLIRMRDVLIQAQRHTEFVQHNFAAQLTQTHSLRDGLLQAMDDAVLVVDPDYRILFANTAAESMLGQTLVGETVIGAVRHPEMEMLMQDAQLVHGESVERRIEWERHILMVRAMAHQDGTNNFQVLTLRDMTEFQRLERARREMVSNISHELSTPITAIGLLADTLLDSAMKEKPKRTRKLASDISREVQTLTQLVQEMRDLSLIESGQMPVRLTPTELRRIVELSVDPLRPLVEIKDQMIFTEIPSGILVLADEVQIQRAVKNIVHNAVKYSPDGSKIEISATTNDEEAIIAVRDRGPGIPRDDLERIFERFFQVDRSRRSGTGLGLAIVRHIVLAHGGRVWVESEEGHGATFYIALVLAEPPRVDDIILGLPAESVD